MSTPSLLVDGRVLDDRYPGVRRFWIPILCAWAELGGRGTVAYRRGCAPDARLMTAGFSALELAHDVRHPLSLACARAVQQTTADATLSPLYLTLAGARRNIGTVFDLIGRQHPRSLRARLLWEAVMWRTTRAASRIVCATAAAARELEHCFPHTRGRSVVVSAVAPPAPQGEPGVVAGFRLARPYALVVATQRPHKRLSRLAATWCAAAPNLPLVMVGQGTRQLDAPPLLRGLGFVSDVELDALLAGAACLVSASIAEGFGLPILAAMSAGVPVVATRHAALEEVADAAALWCAPDDIAGLVHAARSVITDPAQAAAGVARGRHCAQDFTARRAAQQLARALE